MKLAFWLSLGIVFYTYLGYGILLYLLVRVRRLLKGRRRVETDMSLMPHITLVVAAYNEASLMEAKIRNTLSLHYPEGKLQLVFVTDGSTDQSPDIIREYPSIRLMHRPERKGKIHAIHRAMDEIDTEVVVFTDANTFLNTDALLKIARHYGDPEVGAVSGEKRVRVEDVSDATAGEGFYWKYESTLKRWDSELYSVVGAAGELFSVRNALYEPVHANTILDDFMISMLIAAKGYRIVYEPEAYAMESASDNIKEELKRKIRIAAGGIQSVLWLSQLLNIFRYPLLSFQYISHRVLRWTVTPFFMIAAFLLNIAIAVTDGGLLYWFLLAGQSAFYLMAFLGRVTQQRKVRIKIFFIPYYFCVMNYAVLAGILRYLRKEQGAVWEKAKRREM